MPSLSHAKPRNFGQNRYIACMNLRPPNFEPTRTAAEGLQRRRFTVAEIEHITALGIFHEDERFELIGGEIVPKSPKGIHHELLKSALNRYWSKIAPDDLFFTTETTFRLSVDTFLEPDFVFYSKAAGLQGLNAETALLAVEVANTSLGYDLGTKAKLYAAFGIKELWVIHAVKLETHIHREPRGGRFHYKKKSGRRIASHPNWRRYLRCRSATLNSSK